MACLECENCECKSDCLMPLAKNQLESLYKKTKTVKFRKGEIICKQGVYASKILYLKKGMVKTYLEYPDKDIIFCIKPAKSFIGLEALYNDRVYPYSCTVYEDSEFCMFEADTFQNILEQNGKFAASILQNLNLWVSRVYERMVTLTKKQVAGKLADILICLSERIYNSNDFILTISRKDISDLTQLSPETLSRAIKDFKDEKVIKVEGKHFTILDMAKLKKFSEIG